MKILAVVILGILLMSAAIAFAPSVGAEQSTGSSQPPPFAFDGAYANYQFVVNVTSSGFALNSSDFSLTMGFTITDVNNATQSFNVNETTHSSIFGISSTSSTSLPASFSDPSPFPAFNVSLLNNLTQGTLPTSIFGNISLANAVVKPGVTVNVPAGSFSTYEITISNSTEGNEILGNITNANVTIYVESHSGMVIEIAMSIPYQNLTMPVSLVLESTNVPVTISDESSQSSGSALAPTSTVAGIPLYVFLIVIVVVVAAAGGFLALRMRNRGKTVGAAQPMPPRPPAPPPPAAP